MTRRYLALWFPFLLTDQRRRQDPALGADPFVLVERKRGLLQIGALDAPALRMGLGIGMAVADARARLPALSLDTLVPGEALALLSRLAELCEVFTPLVAVDAPEGLLLDISGCAHLFGGEEALRGRVETRFRRLGFTARATIAATPDAARALVRFGVAAIVPAQQTQALAARLPVAALRLDGETTTALVRAGLKTLADLASRPPRILAARFGAQVAIRLNRILGHEDVRIVPLRPPGECVAEQHFAEPLAEPEAVLGILARLLRVVAAQLERRGQGGRAFEAKLFRTDGVVSRLCVETVQPSRDVASLLRLFRLKVDGFRDPGHAGFGFDVIRLIVLRGETLDPVALSLMENEPGEDTSLAGLVDRLVARLGRDRVLRFVARDTHDPEGASAAVPFDEAQDTRWPAPASGAPPTRPLFVFAPPQRIESMAEVPDGVPLRFRWRRVLHEVVRAEGPERIAPEWWREDAPVTARDYYRVEDGVGRRFWVFRDGLYDGGDPPRWFLHGVFA